MTDLRLSRRSVIGHAAGAVALGAAAPAASAAAAEAAGRLDLTDPRQRARTRAKVIGSIAEETIYTLYRLHLYAFIPDRSLVPLVTMNNLSVAKWKPLANGNYSAVLAECGVYCKFDTDEVLDVWENPITGEKRPIWEFVGGPSSAEFGPDGVTIKGAEIKPASLRMEVLGEMLFVPTASGFTMPNPLKPAEWPTQSSGPTRYWNTQSTYAAKVADILDPRLTSAPAFCQFQNLGSWHPWLGMGNRAGRSYGKAHGTKFTRIDDIPAAARAGIEKKTPEIFSFESWKAPRLELKEYMNSHTPS